MGTILAEWEERRKEAIVDGQTAEHLAISFHTKLGIGLAERTLWKRESNIMLCHANLPSIVEPS
jgi:hypothetical protein